MEKEGKRPPGLRMTNGRPYWRPTKAAIKKGYQVKSVNLSLFAGNNIALRDRCIKLQREMKEWLAGGVRGQTRFDGTFGTLLQIYHSDPKSTYYALKHSSRQPYDTYIRMMTVAIGRSRLDRTDGVEVLDWFAAWAEPAAPGAPRQIAKARMAIAVLKAALTFGVMRRLPGCAEFRAVIDAMRGKFASLPPRTSVVVAGQVEAARAAAHAAGHPRAALCYAIQFEGMVRQWDVKGQWLPIAAPMPSAVIFKGSKWIGPAWANVDANLILRFKPTKTETTTAPEIVIDLAACPMVVEELQSIPQQARNGALIVNPETGRPYTEDRFAELWRYVAKAAGLPAGIWNRDLRKSGTTEAKAAGARHDDVQKVAGHTEGSTVTAKVYDQAALEAHRRVATARRAQRVRE